MNFVAQKHCCCIKIRDWWILEDNYSFTAVEIVVNVGFEQVKMYMWKNTFLWSKLELFVDETPTYKFYHSGYYTSVICVPYTIHDMTMNRKCWYMHGKK